MKNRQDKYMNILGWNASYDKINRYIDIYK